MRAHHKLHFCRKTLTGGVSVALAQRLCMEAIVVLHARGAGYAWLPSGYQFVCCISAILFVCESMLFMFLNPDWEVHIAFFFPFSWLYQHLARWHLFCLTSVIVFGLLQISQGRSLTCKTSNVGVVWKN